MNSPHICESTITSSTTEPAGAAYSAGWSFLDLANSLRTPFAEACCNSVHSSSAAGARSNMRTHRYVHWIGRNESPPGPLRRGTAVEKPPSDPRGLKTYPVWPITTLKKVATAGTGCAAAGRNSAVAISASVACPEMRGLRGGYRPSLKMAFDVASRSLRRRRDGSREWRRLSMARTACDAGVPRQHVGAHLKRGPAGPPVGTLSTTHEASAAACARGENG